MSNFQPGILAPVPRGARYLSFSLHVNISPAKSLAALNAFFDGDSMVVGIGQSLALALQKVVPGLQAFPSYVGAGIDIVSTPCALWCWLRDDDRGALVHKTIALRDALASAFTLTKVIDAFQYADSRDLTGFIDGTENPKNDDAVSAAIVKGLGVGMDGSSFVAVQQWVHNMEKFMSMSTTDQDASIGRRRTDNVELTDAPPSAHVRRTAQESFQPAAFVVRRSMPWADENQQGLVFVAFGRSVAAFDAQLKRMVGLEDGITDALFQYTKPISGSYFWCPPVRGGSLDLRALGL